MKKLSAASPLCKAVAYGLCILASTVILGFAASVVYIWVITGLTWRHSPPDKIANLLQTMPAWLKIGAVQASVGLVAALALGWLRVVFSVRRALQVATLIPVVGLVVGVGFVLLTKPPYPVWLFAVFLVGAGVVAFLLSVALLPWAVRHDKAPDVQAQAEG